MGYLFNIIYGNYDRVNEIHYQNQTTKTEQSIVTSKVIEGEIY